MPAARSFSHERRDCPISGCKQHRWPPGTTRRDLETAAYTSRRSSGRSYQQAHTSNAVGHELELLTSAAQRVMDEARRIERRSKYDGRKVIEDGKRRRRELIGQWVAGRL